MEYIPLMSNISVKFDPPVFYSVALLMLWPDQPNQLDTYCEQYAQYREMVIADIDFSLPLIQYHGRNIPI